MWFFPWFILFSHVIFELFLFSKWIFSSDSFIFKKHLRKMLFIFRFDFLHMTHLFSDVKWIKFYFQMWFMWFISFHVIFYYKIFIFNSWIIHHSFLFSNDSCIFFFFFICFYKWFMYFCMLFIHMIHYFHCNVFSPSDSYFPSDSFFKWFIYFQVGFLQTIHLYLFCISLFFYIRVKLFSHLFFIIRLFPRIFSFFLTND